MTRGARRLGDIDEEGFELLALKLSSMAVVNVSWMYSFVSKSRNESTGSGVQSSAGALMERS